MTAADEIPVLDGQTTIEDVIDEGAVS